MTNVAGLNEVNPNGPFYSSNVARTGHQAAVDEPDLGRLVARADARRWCSTSTTCTSTGRDLGVRWPLNTRINGGARRYADLPLNPANPTMNMSVGESKFDGLNFGVRRRMDKGISLNAWYSLSKATGLGGLGVDELTTNLVQDSFDPYADEQWGPAARTDARHKITLSAVIQLPWGVYASPIFRYRSALPLHIWYGYDNNARRREQRPLPDGLQVHGRRRQGRAVVQGRSARARTVNCGRGAALSQFNLRVSKVFRLPRGMNIEAIAEGFNLFNAINPSFNAGAASSVGVLHRHGGDTTSRTRCS